MTKAKQPKSAKVPRGRRGGKASADAMNQAPESVAAILLGETGTQASTPSPVAVRADG